MEPTRQQTNMTAEQCERSAENRGSADRYYGRYSDPHLHIIGLDGKTYRVPSECMTEAERAAYHKGWDEETDRKSWR